MAAGNDDTWHSGHPRRPADGGRRELLVVLCDDATHDATRDEIRFVRLRPLGIKGKRGLVQPHSLVASSDMLEKPMLRDLGQGILRVRC